MANSAHERRIQNLETTTAALSSGFATVNAKLDAMLVELRGLVLNLTTHTKEDAAVALRVHDLEQASALGIEHAKSAEKRAEERGNNVKNAMWLAIFTVAGDVVLQLLTHFHLIP